MRLKFCMLLNSKKCLLFTMLSAFLSYNEMIDHFSCFHVSSSYAIYTYNHTAEGSCNIFTVYNHHNKHTPSFSITHNYWLTSKENLMIKLRSRKSLCPLDILIKKIYGLFKVITCKDLY